MYERAQKDDAGVTHIPSYREWVVELPDEQTWGEETWDEELSDREELSDGELSDGELQCLFCKNSHRTSAPM